MKKTLLQIKSRLDHIDPDDLTVAEKQILAIVKDALKPKRKKNEKSK